MVPIQVSAGPQLRQFRQPPPAVNNNNATKAEGPPVTVFVGEYGCFKLKFSLLFRNVLILMFTFYF